MTMSQMNAKKNLPVTELFLPFLWTVLLCTALLISFEIFFRNCAEILSSPLSDAWFMELGVEMGCTLEICDAEALILL